MTYTEAEEWLFDLPRFATVGKDAYIPGLERIETLLEAMARPQDAYPSILVAGTNGKGTLTSMIAAISTAAGVRTGLHTSPHLQALGERMRIDGVAADEKWLEKSISEYMSVIKDIGASFFEASVALSFLFFAEKHVGLAVVEVGLGGRLDATNILNPELSFITNIALDHAEILGPELTDIATEKAGVMRSGKPVVVGSDDPAVNMVLGEEADRIGAEFHLLGAEVEITEDEDGNTYIETLRDRYGPVEIALEGRHQTRHAAMAVRASELCSRIMSHSRASILNGLASVGSLSGLRARMEQIAHRPHIWIDVAHNLQSVVAALETRRNGSDPITHIFIGLQKDKDVVSIASAVAREALRNDLSVEVMRMSQARAADPTSLANVFKENSIIIPSDFMTTAEALSRWYASAEPDQGLLVMGSHFIAAEALDWAAINLPVKRT